ncbi:plasma membrane ascorbate-dependent reductase CYBRD1-like [Halichoeres trimaculatus]|uniref:plasma membrane ascorbate-dependent reductase CYBRD1-like n=1 Tax=Halichoeres trimaculatus TaxID=147232 RepID=UPI003D9DCA1D
MEQARHALFAALVFGLFTTIYVLQWVFQYRGGLSGEGKGLFNWHPVLQLSSFIFLNGLAIMVYRLPSSWQGSHEQMKYIHAGLNVAAFLSAVVALSAVFGSQSSSHFPNLFSLHSWLGLTAVALFCAQIVIAASIYLFPFTPSSWRKTFMPVHTFLGRFLFGGIIAVSVIGITEALIFDLNDPKYTDSPAEAIHANIMGLLLVGYGVTVLWVSTRSGKHVSQYSQSEEAEAKVK